MSLEKGREHPGNPGLWRNQGKIKTGQITCYKNRTS